VPTAERVERTGSGASSLEEIAGIDTRERKRYHMCQMKEKREDAGEGKTEKKDGKKKKIKKKGIRLRPFK